MRTPLAIITRYRAPTASATGWALGPSTPTQGSGTTVANFTLTGCANNSTLIVGVVFFNATSSVTSVTCVGESNLTAIGSLQRASAGTITDAACQLYVLDHTTSSGNKVFAVTVTAGTFVDAGGIEFTGGKAGATLDATNKAQAATVSLTTGVNNALIISVGVSAGAQSATANYTKFALSGNAENDAMFYLTSLNAGVAGANTVDFTGAGSAVINCASFTPA